MILTRKRMFIKTNCSGYRQRNKERQRQIVTSDRNDAT